MNIKSKQGQALLVTVMLLATAITIVLSLSFRSTTETQVTKLQEENQKALAAAQAGIDAVLKSGTNGSTIAIGNLPNMTDISGNATVSTVTGDTFITPLLQTDEAYTFYMADYSNGAFSSDWNGSLDIYFQSETNCPALELTFIKDDNSLSRYLMDPCNLVQGASKTPTTNGGTINGINFTYKNSSSFAVANTRLIIARSLFASTKIGLSGLSLKSQGKTVTSTAKSNTGVTKTIQLFQSYPQIPADFFVTSL